VARIRIRERSIYVNPRRIIERARYPLGKAPQFTRKTNGNGNLLFPTREKTCAHVEWARAIPKRTRKYLESDVPPPSRSHLFKQAGRICANYCVRKRERERGRLVHMPTFRRASIGNGCTSFNSWKRSPTFGRTKVLLLDAASCGTIVSTLRNHCTVVSLFVVALFRRRKVISITEKYKKFI